MGWLLPIILWIASIAASAAAIYVAVSTAATLAIAMAIASAIATAASTYYLFTGDIKNSIVFSGIGIVAGLGAVYVGALTAANTAACELMSAMGSGSVSIVTGSTSSATVIWGYVATAKTTIVAFLEAIHFKTILAVHQIAYLVSVDYRNMMNDVFRQISEVSAALGYGAEFMGLALRDTRNIVMDVSSMFGKGYDLCEVTWMGTLQEFFREFDKRADKYKNNPNELLMDLDSMIYKPGIDSKAGTVRVILSSMERTAKEVELIVGNAQKIEKDILRLASDMPEAIRKEILPKLKSITDDFDRFIRVHYTPAITNLHNSLITLGFDYQDTKKKVQDAAERLRRPGKYFRSIKDLPPKERAEDEEDVHALLLEMEDRELVEYYAETEDERGEIMDVGTRETPIVEITLKEKPEGKGPTIYEPPPGKIVKSPFVGEF